MSSLLDLIAQYEDGQRKIDQAIAINRARAAAEPNRRRRLDLDRQHHACRSGLRDQQHEEVPA